jgi:hypothetical protein
VPSLQPLPEGAASLAPLAEGSEALAPLAEGIETLTALGEQFAVTTGYPGLYPSLATFPSARTFPSPGSIQTAPGPVSSPLAEGALTLTPLLEG